MRSTRIDVQNASQSFVCKDEIRFNPFFVATCAWQKIHISLQTCKLFFVEKQCVRCSRLQVHRVSGDVSVKMLRRSILTDSKTAIPKGIAVFAALQQISIHKYIVAYTAAHDKYMKDFVDAETFAFQSFGF